MSDAPGWAGAAIAFLIALVLTPIMRDVFRSYNMVDRPGRRKVHAYPIPRVGGVALAAAWVGSLLWLSPPTSSLAWRLLPAAAVIFLTGLIDDFLSIAPLFKLAGQTLAALLAVRFGNIGLDGLGLPAPFDAVAAVLWLLLAMNALNLIDGLDGLCGGLSVVAALALFGATKAGAEASLADVVLPFTGAMLGFLFYNFHPATVFLGDAGSLFAGLILGAGVLAWSGSLEPVSTAMAPFLLLAVPLGDVALSITRRWLRGRRIFSADRGHIHHRLLAEGWTVRQAAITLYAASALAASLALVLSLASGRGSTLAAYCLLAVGLWVGARALRYPEFEVAGRMIFGSDFKRAVDARVGLEQLERALERAANDDDWWSALVAAGREAGWTRLHRTGAGREREHGFPQAPPAEWVFRVPLEGGVMLEIDGAATSIDLAAVAAAVRRTARHGRTAEAGAMQP